MANYNCAFTVVNDFVAYHDLFYLLMVGSGVGVRVLKSDAGPAAAGAHRFENSAQVL